jgi:hypothetical protein
MHFACLLVILRLPLGARGRLLERGARNQLVDLENLSDEDLKKLEAQFRRMRKQAENDASPSRNAESKLR